MLTALSLKQNVHFYVQTAKTTDFYGRSGQEPQFLAIFTCKILYKAALNFYSLSANAVITQFISHRGMT